MVKSKKKSVESGTGLVEVHGRIPRELHNEWVAEIERRQLTRDRAVTLVVRHVLSLDRAQQDRIFSGLSDAELLAAAELARLSGTRDAERDADASASDTRHRSQGHPGTAG